MDWWRSFIYFAEPNSRLQQLAWWPSRWPCSGRVARFSNLLGIEHLHHLSRHGPAAKGRELGGAVCLDYDLAPIGLGNLESAWTRLLVDTTEQVSHAR